MSRWTAQLLCVGRGVLPAILRAIRRPLFKSAASLDRQLAALGQRCSSGAGSRLPTAAQLQAAWAALVAELAKVRMLQSLPHAERAAFSDPAARALLALQSDNPRSSYELGRAAVNNAAAGSAPRLRDPLPHFQRGIELARAQGRDFWLARWARCNGLG